VTIIGDNKMKKLVVVILLIVLVASGAGALKRLYHIKYRWLLWTPVKTEVTVYPLGDPNNIEYHSIKFPKLDPNQLNMNLEVLMPKTGSKTRVIEIRMEVRRIDLYNYAKEIKKENE
jgi:hypothetical protein